MLVVDADGFARHTSRVCFVLPHFNNAMNDLSVALEITTADA